MWSFGIQHEIAPRTVLSVDYMGRRAYNLYGAYNANQPEIFRNGFLGGFKAAAAGGESALLDQLTRFDSRRTAAETGAAFLRRQFPTELSLNSVGAVAQNLGQRFETSGGQRVSATSLSGLGPYYFFPYPQFGNVRVIDSNDFSTYHGLEVQIMRRMAQGPRSAVQLDLVEVARHALLRSVAHHLRHGHRPVRDLAPVRSGQPRPQLCPIRLRPPAHPQFLLDVRTALRRGPRAARRLKAVIGGWSISGFFRYQTGRPFTIFSGANTLSNVFQSTVQCNGCTPDDGHVFTNSAGIIQYIDQAMRDKMVPTPAGEIGNTGRNFFNLAPTFNMDASLAKRINITEKIWMQLRADATNLTNTPLWDVPTAVRTSGSFGNLTGPSETPGSRKIQLGAKIYF